MNKDNPKQFSVPTFPFRAFKWFCRPEYHDDIEGDLLELFAERTREKNLRKAKILLFFDILLLFRPSIIRPMTINHPFIPYAMYRNYFKIAWRSMLKQKFYAVLNIGGLAIGLTAFILIFIYVQHELSYDRFLPNSEHIYRIYSQQKGNTYLGSDYFAVTPAGLAPALENTYPEVSVATSVQARSTLLGVDEQFFVEKGVVADPHFFEVFPFKFLQGNMEKSLESSHSIVLTQSLATKLFGNKDPMNQVILYQNDTTFTVTGVIQDLPEKSSIQLDFVASILSDRDYVREVDREAWNNNSYITFFELRQDADPAALQEKLPQLIALHRSEEEHNPFSNEYYVQALHDLHLETKANFDIGMKGNPQYIRLFSWIALLVLLLACVNYTNLAIARSIRRAKEVGLRKVIGARKFQLMGQFLGESFIVSFLALILSLLISMYLLPFFGNLLERNLRLSFIETPLLIPGLILLMIFVGLISGSYPALVMSSLKPIRVLKGKGLDRLKSLNLQKVLIISQYTVSIGLVICSIIFYQQFQFIQSKELGFNKDHIVTFPVSWRDFSLRENFDRLANIWNNNPRILSYTACTSLPTNFDSSTFIKKEKDAGSEENIAIYRGRVDYNYLDIFEIPLLTGRNFSKDFPTDAESAIILNETAVKALGWSLDSTVEKQLYLYGDEKAKVIGVVKDFHMHSMRMKIEPLMLELRNNFFNHIAFKVQSNELDKTMNYLTSQLEPQTPYPMNFQFLDERFDSLYESDIRLGKIFGFFTLLSVLIASIGLFGLAAFAAGQRTKEIGIRKVLGASVQSIVNLLSKDFLEMVVLGFFIAIPIAWFAMHKWLEGFAYNISIKWWVFALAGAGAMLLAFLTISSQSIKAALVNPVECLVDE
ncbi:MAG: ABC transporter permease [Bacteroidota bacterium]